MTTLSAVDRQTHRLVDVRFVPSPDHGGEIAPDLIVIHYTGGGSARGSIEWLCAKDENYLSAHLVIDRDGAVTQLVPFNRRAFHAGRSAWKGRTDLNHFSIGIELANYGPCLPLSSGNLITSTGVELPRERGLLCTTHPSGSQSWWEAFPAAQFDSCAAVCQALRDAYPLTEIVGHRDIAPGRKIDPGPAFDMTELRRRAGFLDA